MRNYFVLLTLGFMSLFPAHALEVHQITTPRGINVWFAPDKTVPVISMAYSFENAGTAHEPIGKEGVAALAADLLHQGAGTLDANGFSEKVAELAVGIGFGADADYFRGSFKTTLRTKKEAIQLLKDVLYKAVLPQDRLEILRQQALSSHQAALKDPNYILGKTVRDVLYAGHAYGRSSQGTLESLKSISREDIQSFLKKSLGRSTLRVAICGNLSKDEVIALVDGLFADLPQHAQVTPLPPLAVPYSGKVFAAVQDIPQSLCLFYHPGLPAEHKDYTKLMLIVKILGGGFDSRLSQEVREKRGLAYTINAFLSRKKQTASVAGFVGTENAQVPQALDIIRTEYAKLASFGVTEQELKDAKQAAIGSFILRLSSTAAIAAQLLTYQEIDYDVSYVNERASLINSMTLSSVNACIQDIFDPKKLTFFVVGGKEPSLQKND